jgi:small subunit ribosomal protein S20
MPHTSSAKKRLRQTEKRRRRNRTVAKGIKLQVKKFQATAKSGSLEELQKEYNLSAKALDKAAAKGVLHRNTVARKKSQLARMVHQKKTAGQQPAAPG